MNISLVDQKIILLRKAKGISKSAFATDVLHCDPSRVRDVENGLASFLESEIKLAKTFFDIENLPLEEQECIPVHMSLYYILDHNRAERYTEAKAILDDLAKLVNLDPCDKKLPTLYRLFDTHYHIVTNQLVAAKETLDFLQGRYGEMDTECRYYFYFNTGFLHSVEGRDSESLEAYKKALALTESQKDFVPNDIERLHASIGACYTNLELPFHAIFYLRDIRKKYGNVEKVKFNLHTAILLATNFLNIRRFKASSELLNNCFIRAESIKNRFYLGWTTLRLGELNAKTENWEVALEYLDKALMYLDKGTKLFLSALYKKIRCLSGNKQHAEAKQLLEESISLYGTDKVFGPLFRMLRRFVEINSRISLYSNEAVEYLETVAIPYLLKTNDRFEAVDYCMLLVLYYSKKNKMKALSMLVVILGIYMECLLTE